MSKQGHNSEIGFDAIVEENLRRGLLLTHLEVLMRAGDDPRLEKRHYRLLIKIIQRTNNETGMAFPGRKKLADDTKLYAEGVEGDKGYSESTIAKIISELIEFGYLVYERRAPEGSGRGAKALAHYALAKPSVEELQQQITTYINHLRTRKPPGPPNIQARLPLGDMTSDDASGGNVTSQANEDGGGNVTPRRNVRSQGNVTASPPPDVPTGVPTVTIYGSNLHPLHRGGGGEAKVVDDNDPSTAMLQFIAKHTNVSMSAARTMMATNIMAYGADAMLEGFAAALGVMATQAVARPYQMMLKCAENARDRIRKAKAAGASGSVPADDDKALSNKLIKAMKQHFQIGSASHVEWSEAELGPLPGKSGCRLSDMNQLNVWRQQVTSMRACIPQWRETSPAALGSLLYERIQNWWGIDTLKPNCPVPGAVLDEFHVPATADALARARASAASGATAKPASNTTQQTAG